MDATLMRGSCSNDEVMKCVNLGLLCVQEDVTKRPTMTTIIHMLNSSSDASTAPSMLQPPSYLYSSGSEYSTTTRSNTSSSLPSTTTRSDAHSKQWSQNY